MKKGKTYRPNQLNQNRQLKSEIQNRTEDLKLIKTENKDMKSALEGIEHILFDLDKGICPLDNALETIDDVITGVLRRRKPNE